jgi:membrane protein
MDSLTRLRTFVRRDLWTVDADALGFAARLGIRVLRLAMVAATEFRDGVFSLRATGLVYTTLLSLVPLLAVMFSVLKGFGAHNQIEPFLSQALAPLGDKGDEITRRVIEFVSNLRVGVLGTVGVAALFVTVVSLLNKIEAALNHIWRVRHPRPLHRKFSDYLSVVLVGPILVVAAFALTASAQSHWLVQRVVTTAPFGHLLVTLLSRVTPFVLLCAAFTFLYKFVPNTRVPLGSALVGGASAGLLWQIAGTAFAAFVVNSPRYAVVYSGFAILVLFLIWVYVAWLIVLVGAAIAYFHQHPAAYLTQALHRGGAHAFRERLALGALVEIARRHLAAAPPSAAVELAAALGVPPSTLDDLLEEFVHRGVLVRSAEPEGLALARAPETVAVVDVLDAVCDPGPVRAEGPRGDAVIDRTLRRRDEAVRAALEGVTLRTLAVEDGGGEPGRATGMAAASRARGGERSAAG